MNNTAVNNSNNSVNVWPQDGGTGVGSGWNGDTVTTWPTVPGLISNTKELSLRKATGGWIVYWNNQEYVFTQLSEVNLFVQTTLG